MAKEFQIKLRRRSSNPFSQQNHWVGAQDWGFRLPMILSNLTEVKQRWRQGKVKARHLSLRFPPNLRLVSIYLYL